MADFRLRVFQAVARHLSFTQAAQELFITQPAITMSASWNAAVPASASPSQARRCTPTRTPWSSLA
ncbi:hypothetical protein BXP70_24030 [Hymenobacter crusticola]|uniref:HTH lysR-type domain-containing protein n=1 Tax=Hymenobacter crusticola TaxID=1770526 RepID=A0A2C9ZU13_9BACT|nr:hypothetical protein BXP70_24030 [Hymenobacter crusticola]